MTRPLLAPVDAPAPAAPAGGGPDAALIELAAEYLAVSRAWIAMGRRLGRMTEAERRGDKSEKAARAMVPQMAALEERIAALPARTFAGLRAKAAAARHAVCSDPDRLGEPDDADNSVPWSLAEDALALLAPAARRAVTGAAAGAVLRRTEAPDDGDARLLAVCAEYLAAEGRLDALDAAPLPHGRLERLAYEDATDTAAGDAQEALELLLCLVPRTRRGVAAKAGALRHLLRYQLTDSSLERAAQDDLLSLDDLLILQFLEELAAGAEALL